MILVGGENLIDFIQEPQAVGHPTYRAIPGGSPFNVAKAMARQDQPVGYLTPFSTDTLGDLLADDLSAELQLEVLSPRSDLPTTLAVVSLRDGQARYRFYRERTAERDVTAASLRTAMAPGAEAFFVGSLALTAAPDADIWADLATDLAADGLFTAIDPNIRPALIADRAAFTARLDRLCATVDLIKLSDEDLAWLAPGEPPEAAARGLSARCGADLLVLTRGGEGALALGPAAGEISVPAHPVRDMRDTVGAGDTFMGTLLAQLRRTGRLRRGALRDLDADALRALLSLAARAAALNCERVGCDPPRSAALEV
ncbi:MAG: PfkB family carbohydrate kinase [Pseudomonadota bacterium]